MRTLADIIARRKDVQVTVFVGLLYLYDVPILPLLTVRCRIVELR